MKEQLLPEGWVRPKGYANGIKARGTFVFTAGVIGWNSQEEFETDDFLGQLRQTLENTRDVLAEAGAQPEDIVRMTWYVTSKQEYVSNLKEIGAIWRDILGRVYPCVACIEVSALIEDRAKIEIETTAVIDDEKQG